MKIFVDKILPNDLGAITDDTHKIEYILAVHNKSLENILKQIVNSASIPNIMFSSGKFIFILNFKTNPSALNLCLINYETEIDKNFNAFGNSFSLKSISGFKRIQKELKQNASLNQIDLNKIELSDNESDFVKAYGEYIEHRKD